MTTGTAAETLPKRRETRLPVTLEVRICGIDANGKAFHQPATTLDIGMSGTRITGLTAPLNKGDIVGLQSGGAKSRFKVAWVKGNRVGTFQVGLHCIEKGGCPWHNVMQRVKEGDRRSNERYPCNGSVSLRSASIPTPILGTLHDISTRGCYVQCDKVAPTGEILSGEFVINGVQFSGVAEVRHSLPALGMGLLWCDLGFDGQEKLKIILRSLVVDSFDADTGKEMVMSQVGQLHQLVATLRERLESDHAPVNTETIGGLRDAQEGLTAALKSLQA